MYTYTPALPSPKEVLIMSDCGDVKKVFVPSNGSSPLPPVTTGILITPVAASKIKLFLEKDQQNPQEYGLHIAVVKDGCSGKSYVMKMAPIQASIDNGDRIFESDGATVMIDKVSYLFVTGSTLDYTEALTGSGFALHNPNIKKTCSCGSSFAT